MFDGVLNMTIMLFDKVEERKAVILQELKLAGWLLTESNTINDMNIRELLASTQIIILLDPDAAIEWTNPVWKSVLSRIVVIGHGSLTQKTVVKEVVDYSPTPLESYKDLARGLLKKVESAYYHHVLPITTDEKMKSMLATAKMAAASSASIMIVGETGTGKEVVAQYIHHHSKFRNGPFVAVNCAAIPEAMIEAVLFGYEKGSFTNALNSYTGKFEKANHGTLFLDEIGEMSTDLQAKLLRVLQKCEFERLGGKETIKVNIKVIAATNKNLAEQISKGLFRSDLYYRLNVISLKCYPLRERPSDIYPLSEYFVNLYSQEMERKCVLDASAVVKLGQYTWPGNVRELQNVIHRAVILDDDGVIDANDIEYDSTDISNYQSVAIETGSLRANEAETIVKVLKETKGCRNDAAKKLMISPRTLRYKISKLKEVGIEIP